jgi:hypothetical protein
MFPWLWIYAPRIAWPLSGAVTEAVSTDAFFRGIKPGAGVPAVEQQVFEQASYGKQLGWLTSVLVEAVEQATLRSQATLHSPATLHSREAQSSFLNLKKLQATVERIKNEHRQDRLDAAIALLDQLQADSPEELARLLQRYQVGGQPVAAPPPQS